MHPLTGEKIRADVMRTTATDPLDAEYWTGYRHGLAAQSEEHDTIMGGIGSPDLARDARGRGYRDGLTWAAEARED